MANLSGSVIELSNYLEQKISQKSAEYASVSITLSMQLSVCSNDPMFSAL